MPKNICFLVELHLAISAFQITQLRPERPLLGSGMDRSRGDLRWGKITQVWHKAEP
jgi:hypothetical protein